MELLFFVKLFIGVTVFFVLARILLEKHLH